MEITAKKYVKNPILLPKLNEYPIEYAVYNPTVIGKDGKVIMFYRSELGHNFISRINMAESLDGFSFVKYAKNPVIKPENGDEKMGCEDPRIIKTDDGRYFMTYTAYFGKDEKGLYKFSLYGAFSKNLLNWEKFKIKDGIKSGVVVKMKDKYAMYVGGETIKIGYSSDLKNWELEDKAILPPRQGNCFDSFLTEAGCAIVLKDKIVLVYNAKDKNRKFSVGYAIFDFNDPGKLLERCDKAVLEPEKYWELYGKINNAVFATGLINFKSRLLLYYGGSDKAIGVAELELKKLV